MQYSLLELTYLVIQAGISESFIFQIHNISCKCHPLLQNMIKKRNFLRPDVSDIEALALVADHAEQLKCAGKHDMSG
ncbi:MAG: hypothetical protein ACOH1I_00970 [Gallionellaceae bacterium]|jgi:hypothetical protein